MIQVACICFAGAGCFFIYTKPKKKEEMSYGSKEAYENRPDPVRADAENARFLEWTESGNTGRSKQESVFP
jgi:hypothetical protein